VRTSWGQPAYNPPSRFLDELPGDTVHWARTEPAPAASNAYSSAQARVAATGLSTGGLRGGAGNRPVISVEIGDRVSHDAFGLGTVVEVTGVGDKAQATVDFGSGGTKRLVLRYAPLTKL
jgi:DNA helicase-2/ATP-dependent DNA helicase PcrA